MNLKMQVSVESERAEDHRGVPLKINTRGIGSSRDL